MSIVFNEKRSIESFYDWQKYPERNKHKDEAKKTCPVSKALAGPEITLKAKFLGAS